MEKFGQRFVVKCNDLKFKLTVDRNGEKGHVSEHVWMLGGTWCDSHGWNMHACMQLQFYCVCGGAKRHTSMMCIR